MKEISKRYLVIGLSFLLMIVISLITPPATLTSEAMSVLGIFAGCLLLWLTIGIDWPSLLCIVLVGFLPSMNFKSVLSGAFGGETFVFLLATFLCTYALSQTQFLRRCAIGFVTSKIAQKGPWYFTISFFAAVIVVGSFMSPTVMFVIFLPILEEVYKVLNISKGDKVGAMLMMGLAFCTSISSGMTPIAHVFSIMAMGAYTKVTGKVIGYGEYMAFGIPVGIITVIIMILLFKFLLKVDMSNIKKIDITHLKKSVTPIDTREIICIVVFLSVIALWVLPDLLKGPFPALIATLKPYGTAMPPLVGAVILSIISVDKKQLLNPVEAMKNGVPWASLLMTAGTLTLGSAMTNKDIGLSKYLTDTFGANFSEMAPMILVIIFATWAAIQTNLSSNMVTVTVVTAVAIPITLATKGAVNTAAVVSMIGLLASFAFATPPSMPHIALAGSSGWTTVAQVFKYGGLLMIISIVITVVIGYPIASSIMENFIL